MGKAKKRSRSRSKERSKSPTLSKRRLQNQIEALAKSVQDLIKSQQALQEKVLKPVDLHEDGKEDVPANKAATNLKPPDTAEETEENDGPSVINLEEGEFAEQNYDLDDELREVLGEEIPESNVQVKINDNLRKWWESWMSKGLSEEVRKALLKKYPRDSTFKTEAPKVNLEIERHLTHIAKKRDDHFAETQNCIGVAISSLSSAVSLLSDSSQTAVDQISLVKNLWDTGKILCDVFHQQSVPRKSFITPTLDKDIKTTLEASISDEWLYGQKLNEQVKEAKAIVKASATLKPPERPAVKKQVSRSPYQGNSRGPPAKFRQVGTYQQRKFFNNRTFKHKYATTTPKSAQKTNTEKNKK